MFQKPALLLAFKEQPSNPAIQLLASWPELFGPKNQEKTESERQLMLSALQESSTLGGTLGGDGYVVVKTLPPAFGPAMR